MTRAVSGSHKLLFGGNSVSLSSQFPDIVEFSEAMANTGKTVIVAALDGTFQRKVKYLLWVLGGQQQGGGSLGVHGAMQRWPDQCPFSICTPCSLGDQGWTWGHSKLFTSDQTHTSRQALSK